MNIGHILKTERIKQNVKQVCLANGVCSVSYLSKIENNLTVPSDEILELLCKRLNIVINLHPEEKEQLIIDNLFALYKNAILNKDVQMVKKKCTLSNLNQYFLDCSLFNTYFLYLFRINLMLDSNSSTIREIKQILIKNQKNFNSYQNFLFNLNMGLYHYSKGFYKEALRYLELQDKEKKSISMEDWEKYDYYYVRGLCNLVNDQVLSAIEYTELALKYFQNIFIVKKMLDCYIVISNGYKRNFKYTDARNLLIISEKIIENGDIAEYRGIVYQNIGDLYSKEGNDQMALDYYMKSYHSEKDTLGYLTSTLSIVMIYSKMNISQKVIEWSELGLNFIQGENSGKYTAFSHHFKVFKALHIASQDDLVPTCKEAISFFETRSDFRFAHKYSILIAKYFSEKAKYKDSHLYYQKANQYLYQIKCIHAWEEL
ncbi:helix-turn-helix domain-containing protein [Viridibacillus sp. NPDC096237]|uniref:helix-turn-helix domain-containing protein n=1 Tax=Viridibacillus sp. NPDC096237 TaxID=3390721 RepID=UPI003D022D2A